MHGWTGNAFLGTEIKDLLCPAFKSATKMWWLSSMETKIRLERNMKTAMYMIFQR